MFETLTTMQVVDRLLADDCAAWTRAGAWALAEYLESLEDEAPVEFDRVAIRCEYSEYGSACAAAAELLGGAWGDDAEAVIALERHTTVIGVPGGGVIVQSF